jgi:MFS family permease
LLMLPLIVRPALIELGGLKPGTPAFNTWLGVLFWVPAIAGGIFGLLGGYLTDRLGRRRVLVWSILIYAGSAFAAGFSTSLPMLLVLRSLTFIGVCVEFVAAIAWLAELFPERERREPILGYTQAFASIGGLMVTTAYYFAATHAASLPPIYGAHAPWRYTLMSGLIPALPLIVIRPFLPESPAWEEKRRTGTLRRPSVAELFLPEFRRTTLVMTLMIACTYGAAFGAIQQMPSIARGLDAVRALPTDRQREQAVSVVQGYQETGGLVGRFALAFLAVRILSRRALLRIFQAPGLVVLPLVFAVLVFHDLTAVSWGIFFVGFLTVAQMSFWGNYMPLVYPTRLRGTGEGFAQNVGGRLLGTSAAFIAAQLANVTGGATPSAKLAYAAAIVGTSVYAIGFVASFFLPEPRQDRLID